MYNIYLYLFYPTSSFNIAYNKNLFEINSNQANENAGYNVGLHFSRKCVNAMNN